MHYSAGAKIGGGSTIKTKTWVFVLYCIHLALSLQLQNKKSAAMGIYINTGNEGFQSARNSEYVDKSRLIAVVNDTLFSEARFTCVSRCRRFGKSMAAKMLCAYYDHSVDSRSLFADLEIASHPSFEEHLNRNSRSIYNHTPSF